MTTVAIAPVPFIQVIEGGIEIAGALIYTYASGTSTKLASYTDATGNTPHTNPIVCSAEGKATIYLAAGILYDFVVCPANDTDPPTNSYNTYSGLYCSAISAVPYADATGTADVITADYVVTSPVLVDGYVLILDIATSNATTTPTFAPTLNGVLQTARTIQKVVGNANVALAIGDLQGMAMLVYDLSNLVWILQNPTLVNAASAVNRAYTTGGTSTAYTITPVPAITAYAANQTFDIIFNAICGASPTLAISGIATPPNLVSQNADGTYTNISAGAIPAGWQSTVKLISATQALVLKLPQTASPKLPQITATVAANALTIGMSAQMLDFRSATLGSGTISTINCAPSNLVVSSGSTLGMSNTVAAKLAVAVINNAGTPELAVANMAGLSIDESTLISTTAEGGAGAADSTAVWYSTTARSNIAFRIVGYIDITEATAGTWATSPSTIQGSYNSNNNNRDLTLLSQIFTSNGTWIKPSWLTGNEIIRVEMWAGGGGGTNSGTNSGGGGGGAYNIGYFKASSLAATVAVVVGLGGTYTATIGNDGGNSSFGTTLLTAYGGIGGGAGGGGGGGTASKGSVRTGGAGYWITTGVTDGDATSIELGGAGGNSAIGGDAYYGGGGGGAGSSHNGGSSVYGGGGGGSGQGNAAGGVSIFGGNGGGRGTGAPEDGHIPGGGGASGTSEGSAGNGARGEVRVTVLS